MSKFSLKDFAKNKLDGYKAEDEKRAARKAEKKENDILWKPSEGENVIRIVPLKGNENPFQELLFHYGFAGHGTIISPVSFGEKDPIQEFANEARSEGGLTKEQWLETKKFDPKMRTYVPIIVRGQEDKGVLFWSFGIQIYKELLTAGSDPDYGDLHDVKEGHDIKVNYVPAEKSKKVFADGKKVPETSITIRPKPSVLGTAQQIKDWTTNQPDLLSNWTRYSFEELKDILEKYLTPAKSESEAREVVKPADNGWGEEEAAAPAAVKAPKPAGKVAADVSKEFEELFES